MTTYRVGPTGATILDEDGRPLARLRPGLVVVEGVLDMTDEPHRPAQARRGYETAVLRPEEPA